MIELGVATVGGERVLVAAGRALGERLRCLVIDGRRRWGSVGRCRAIVGGQLMRGECGRRGGAGQLLLGELCIVDVVLRLRVGRSVMGDRFLNVTARCSFVGRNGIDEVRFGFGATTVLAGRQGEVLRMRGELLCRRWCIVCVLQIAQWRQQIVAEAGRRKRRRRIHGGLDLAVVLGAPVRGEGVRLVRANKGGVVGFLAVGIVQRVRAGGAQLKQTQ